MATGCSRGCSGGSPTCPRRPPCGSDAGCSITERTLTEVGDYANLNEGSVLPMARYGRDSGHIVRFIEYMDVGTTNGWRLDDVVPAAEIVRRIDDELPLEPVDPTYPGEVAARYRYRDGGGEVGVISSVTQPFCATCTRARLSAIGELYTCLFAASGTDLRGLLRSGATDAELEQFICGVWTARTDRYSEQRSKETRDLPRVEMSYLGG
jgi:GTP 3',8-cyclase